MENKPILFYARTDLNTNLVIDWDSMLTHERNQSVSFTSKPQYFAAVMISKVIKLIIILYICLLMLISYINLFLQFLVYNDSSDTVELSDNSSEVFMYDTQEMSWQLIRTNFSSNSLAMVAFKLESYRGSQVNSMEVIVS